MSSGYAGRLRQAAREDLEDGDGVVELGPPLAGPCDAVAFLPGRTLVAADVAEDWVTALLPPPHDGPPEARSVPGADPASDEAAAAAADPAQAASHAPQGPPAHSLLREEREILAKKRGEELVSALCRQLYRLMDIVQS